MFLQNSYVEVLNPNATVFGERAREEVIKVKDVIKVGLIGLMLL